MGWLQNADLVLEMPFRGRGIPQHVRAKALDARGRDFAARGQRGHHLLRVRPAAHMIETGHLRVTPASKGRGMNIVARKNALRFGEGGLAIPLPTIDTPTDDRGNPFFITNIFAGSSSQFGASARHREPGVGLLASASASSSAECSTC
jgi:hypothetical protein